MEESFSIQKYNEFSGGLHPLLDTERAVGGQDVFFKTSIREMIPVKLRNRIEIFSHNKGT
jgi:hypothetical protein